MINIIIVMAMCASMPVYLLRRPRALCMAQSMHGRGGSLLLCKALSDWLLSFVPGRSSLAPIFTRSLGFDFGVKSPLKNTKIPPLAAVAASRQVPPRRDGTRCAAVVPACSILSL